MPMTFNQPQPSAGKFDKLISAEQEVQVALADAITQFAEKIRALQQDNGQLADDSQCVEVYNSVFDITDGAKKINDYAEERKKQHSQRGQTK
jgi:small-conductance mechanosensitive channel